MRTRGASAGGALLAVALLLQREGHLDAERWSRYDPTWRHAAWALLLLYGLALLAVTLRLRPAGPRHGAVIPLLLAAPAILLKPEATDLAAWTRPFWLLTALPLCLLLVHLGLRAVGAGRRRLLLLSLVGLLLLGGLRFGERCAMEEVIASGEVENLLRRLADRLGDATAAAGPPAGEVGEWLKNELGPADWYVDGDLWYWAPAPGVAPTAVRLRYHTPEAGSLWSVALTAEPYRPICPRARPYTAEITWDGGIAWSWPEGPPAAVVERRAAVEGAD